MSFKGRDVRVTSIRDLSHRKQAEDAFRQQLTFSKAINSISKTVVELGQPDLILKVTLQVIGETLMTDRALIYDISFKTNQAIGLCEYLDPQHPDIASTKATYPLDIFIGGTTEVRKTRKWLTSQRGQINPHFVQDGSSDILHNQMKIESLLWYPFHFSEDGFYLFAFNEIYKHRDWSQVELDFMDSVSHLVTVALEKIHLLNEHERTANDLRIAATAFESQEAMLITDAQANIMRVNQAFIEVTGFTNEEVVGKSPRVLSSGRHDASFYQAMWGKINNTGKWVGEIWNRRKDGSLYPEQLSITSVKDSTGKVTNYVGAFTDITARKLAEEEIHGLAFYDPLTKLPNRRLLLDRLQQALASSTRSGSFGALLFLDLDHFKNLNDTLGHDIGDQLLQQVALRLQSTVRVGDTVSRLGGDEFVVMLEDLSAHELDAATQVEAVLNKTIDTLSTPYTLEDHEYQISTSIGVTLFQDHHQAQELLLRQADIAMYQAKKAGRNTFRFFDNKMQEAIYARVNLEHDLRKAIEQRQFALHYQIQVDETNLPIGAEALIRWERPDLESVQPSHFIPLAEETGLILPIGQWVIETACAQLQAWSKVEATRNLVLSLNISAKQFRQPDFVNQLINVVRRFAIDPRMLKLELTESMLLDTIEETITSMESLRDFGIQFSLDDFGTGYSSLQYLKRLPLSQIKIDQSFVRDLATDSNDKTIVRTIIAMAKSLNLSIIAEGVETDAQRTILLLKGCNHFQGYLFGKPAPIDQFETLLSRDK